jgi:hypothetical protein
VRRTSTSVLNMNAEVTLETFVVFERTLSRYFSRWTEESLENRQDSGRSGRDSNLTLLSF